MAISLELIQEGILDHLETTLPYPIVEQAVPDIDTVRRNTTTKRIEPYVAIQFGDIQQGRRYNLASPMGDDYILPIYSQAVAPTAKAARQISNRLLMNLLAQTFPWSGSVRKRSGGSLWPIVNSNNATEAYMNPSSFGLLIQLTNDA